MPSTLHAGRVSALQASKALKGLLSFYLDSLSEEAGQAPRHSAILDGEDSDKKPVVFVQLALHPLDPDQGRSLFHSKASRRERRIALAHPLSKQSVCLFTPDPQRWWKDALVEQGVTVITRVVGVSQLGTKFHKGPARQQLMEDHDVFVADGRLGPVLRPLLGPKWWSDQAKRPVAVDLRDPAQIKAHLEEKVSCTFFHPPHRVAKEAGAAGETVSIRIGHLRVHTLAQLAENLGCVLDALEGIVPGGWDSLKAIDVKLATSAALPLWRPEASGGNGSSV